MTDCSTWTTNVVGKKTVTRIQQTLYFAERNEFGSKSHTYTIQRRRHRLLLDRSVRVSRADEVKRQAIDKCRTRRRRRKNSERTPAHNQWALGRRRWMNGRRQRHIAVAIKRGTLQAPDICPADTFLPRKSSLWTSDLQP